MSRRYELVGEDEEIVNDRDMIVRDKNKIGINVKSNSLLQMGCINVRGWNLGKFKGLSDECREWNIDVIGVTETNLRGEVDREDEFFKFIGKGRERISKKGGGVGIMVRKCRDIDIQQLELKGNEWSEDILVAKCDIKLGESRKSYIIIVFYMTVQESKADKENKNKYKF